MRASGSADLSGVLVVDKPRGPTSHDVVRRIRKTLGIRKVGHAGTLDPMATGVLVVAVGEATKLVPYLTDAAKTYLATILLGRETDTLDAMGQTVRESPLAAPLTAETIEKALRAERLRTTQRPPAFSAISIGGERSHARARRGETVVHAERPVRVHELELLVESTTPEPSLEIRVRADKGYFVRALARDLAAELGTVGHLTSLRRVDSGGFSVEGAASYDASKEELVARLLSTRTAALRALPSVTLTDDAVKDARAGREVTGFISPVPSDVCVWLDGAGDIVAIARGHRVVRGFAP